MGHKIILDADAIGVVKEDNYEEVCDAINTLFHYFVLKHADYIAVEFSDGETYKVKCRETGSSDFKSKGRIGHV